VLSATVVFQRAVPILRQHGALFKVPASLEVLIRLNAGLVEFSQVGKFLTIYPQSTAEAVALARELHARTRGLAGPAVPFDQRYRPGSLVHYRYGAYRRTEGSARAVVFAGRSKPVRDRRTNGSAVPSALSDPFRRHSRRRTVARGLLGTDYLPFLPRAQRGKGGVYEALDITVSPARKVIIKEGRRHGDTSLDGTDGYGRVRHEGRVLRALCEAGAAVPQVIREFSENGNRYLVIEKLKGRPLLLARRTQAPKPSCRRAARVLREMRARLNVIHSAGWAWRDCKPEHMLVARGRINLIDFEGACRITDQDVLPWTSPRYAPPAVSGRHSRSPGTAEDDHALGVIAFQLTTGAFPPKSVQARRRALLRAHCPAELRATIEQLLSTAA
jgi:tRNA A-37 threonylcarbamoyl transferase component Bud32